MDTPQLSDVSIYAPPENINQKSLITLTTFRLTNYTK